MESHHIATQAQFTIDSLPNADRSAVERLIGQLDAIKTVLLSLDDPATSLAEQDELLSYVFHLSEPLKAFLDAPSPSASFDVPRQFTHNRGCPAYTLNLERAYELHNLGNTWHDISKAMGVSRSTLYRHMEVNGHSMARPEWTEIAFGGLEMLISVTVTNEALHLPTISERSDSSSAMNWVHPLSHRRLIQPPRSSIVTLGMSDNEGKMAVETKFKNFTRKLYII
jgi:hypothetical protein